jgi:hypothetical protein
MKTPSWDSTPPVFNGKTPVASDPDADFANADFANKGCDGTNNTLEFPQKH